MALKEEDVSGLKERATAILEILKKKYTSARVALKFSSPLEILVATILSAQCTDAKVNEVTSSLFKKYHTAKEYAQADLKILEQEIRSTGFYRNKARYIKQSCGIIAEKFGSKVPYTMEELLQLPGVARKTANIVLSNAYGVVEGIAVDTHVRRVSQRLGLTKNKDPDKIEKDLMRLFPKEAWFPINYLVIELGRDVCVAGIPYCERCPLVKLCPLAFSFGQRGKKVNATEQSL
jgi:endonuclease-3